MDNNWKSYNTWIAHFDVIGFKYKIDNEDRSLYLDVLKDSIDEVLQKLQKQTTHFESLVNYTFYADTFIIYATSPDDSGYPEFINISKDFIRNCILKRLPVRGAVSYGNLIIGHNSKIIMGKAFLEAYEYCEDQNWIGLILAPSASKRLTSLNLIPLNLGFINQDIPMRKFSIFDEEVYAYQFINGSNRHECYLLPMLKEMQQRAPKQDKVKFTNTIKFIERHYKIHNSLQIDGE
jgi:hypothetical protein